jgi:hypothetical protein
METRIAALEARIAELEKLHGRVVRLEGKVLDIQGLVICSRALICHRLDQVCDHRVAHRPTLGCTGTTCAGVPTGPCQPVTNRG